jgi:predicted anti-sigma-YlaC factor YlaD
MPSLRIPNRWERKPQIRAWRWSAVSVGLSSVAMSALDGLTVDFGDGLDLHGGFFTLK